MPSLSSSLYTRVHQILESARAGAARSVNTTQVVANWLIGREIVEAQQGGKLRAAYGKKLLLNLSSRLTKNFGRGYSPDNLEAFRSFYLGYPQLISETASRKSDLSSLAIGSTLRAESEVEQACRTIFPRWLRSKPRFAVN